MSNDPRQTSKAFTLVELLVVIGIITVLIAILLPALTAAQERARRIKCASNLRQIDLALRVYAQDNKGRYPRGRYDAPSGPNAFGRDPFRGEWNNDTSVPLFLLVRSRLITLDTVLCPSTTQVRDTLAGESLQERWNFTPIYQHSIQPCGTTLSYSFASQYPPRTDAGDPISNYRPPPNVAPDFAVAADRNDGQIVPLLKPNPSAGLIRAGNSSNHIRAGQNVLYNDGHVAWSKTPFCGHKSDNIYGSDIPDTGGLSIPQHRDDSVLLPGFSMWWH